MAVSAGRLDQYPGRVKIDHVIIEKIDTTVEITDLLVEFNIYSSIIDATNIASVLLNDARNVISNLPIEAGDRVKIQVRFLDKSHEYIFRIANISSIQNLEKQRAYTLECVSDFAFISYYTKISRAYEGTTADIAQAIFNEYSTDKIGIWLQSKNMQQLVIPNWSPLKTIKWLANRSEPEFDEVVFRFFQDSFQRYNFMPIEKAVQFYKDKPPITYKYNADTRMISSNKQQAPNSKQVMESILDLKYNDSFNIANSFSRGSLRSTRFATDINSKFMDIITYDYWEDFKQDKYLNKTPQWSYNDYGIGYTQYDTLQSGTTSISNTGFNKSNDKADLKQSTVNDIQNIDIVVRGNQTVDIGQVVKIEIPSPEPVTDNMVDHLDLRWSGNYYVVAKRDMFNKNDEMHSALTLAKESQIAQITSK